MQNCRDLGLYAQAAYRWFHSSSQHLLNTADAHSKASVHDSGGGTLLPSKTMKSIDVMEWLQGYFDGRFAVHCGIDNRVISAAVRDIPALLNPSFASRPFTIGQQSTAATPRAHVARPSLNTQMTALTLLTLYSQHSHHEAPCSQEYRMPATSVAPNSPATVVGPFSYASAPPGTHFSQFTSCLEKLHSADCFAFNLSRTSSGALSSKWLDESSSLPRGWYCCWFRWSEFAFRSTPAFELHYRRQCRALCKPGRGA